MNNIERLETELKEKEELQIEGELKTIKLLADLNIEERIQLDKLLKIETTLERLKIPKKKINTF